MTTVLSPSWAHPVRAAVPPFTEARLRRVLEKLQRWAPYVDGSLLDDVGHVRQMAWTLNELLELLVTNQCLTEEP